ncbi:MAG: hypothetical protein HKM26_04275 [Winogradskyella sp.]|nr:hypothetical protein [Winogradskyella sp.]
MRHLILILALLSTSSIFSQSKLTTMNNHENPCDYGTEMAITDFSNGKYVMVTYGLIVSQDWDFENYYIDYMAKNYNVIMSFGGCTVLPSELCYSNKMKELLRDKFGANFFEESKEAAKQLYNSK